MDVVTYALLKNYVKQITGDFVDIDDVNSAISTAIADLVSTEEMTSAIATATADFMDADEVNNAILNIVSAITAGFDYKGTVATTTALPSSGNTVGDCYTVTADLGTYVWDGTAWFQYNVNLDLILKAGTEATAEYHLGFYIDSDGDIAQVDE